MFPFNQPRDHERLLAAQLIACLKKSKRRTKIINGIDWNIHIMNAADEWIKVNYSIKVNGCTLKRE